MVMFNHTKIIIPDDSSPDGCASSMWGSYMGNGKQHEFYCKSCHRYIQVKFPRWDKTLNKKWYANDILNKIFRCPGCINSNFIEVN